VVRKKPKFFSRFFIGLTLIFFLYNLVPDLEATTRLMGSIKGQVTDKAGRPIEGAYVYVSSPSLIGFRYFLTRKNGYYYLLELPAGTYKLAVEAPGFHTAIISGIKVETGKNLNLPISMEPAEDEEEEKIILYPIPALDRENPGVSYVLDRQLLSRMPKRNDLSSLLQLAPGINPESLPDSLSFSINGSTVRNSLVTIGNNEVNNPLNRQPVSNLNPDWVEEIEVASAGNPVENYSTSGALIKLIPRDGSNSSSGQLNFIGSEGKLSRLLWTQEELSRLSSANQPIIEDRYHLDSSLNLEGAILPDRAWYFSSLRYERRARPTPFVPWRDPNNIPYPMYNWKAGNFSSLFRFTTQITAEINASVILSFGRSKQTVDPAFFSVYNPQIATLNIAGQSLFLMNLFGTYVIDRETRANLYLFYTRDFLPRRLDPKAVNNPRYVDLGTGYSWGSGPYNHDSLGEVFRAGSSIIRFQTLLNKVHELVAGAEYESSKAEDSAWKNNNLIHYHLFGNPYYYGPAVSPESGNLVNQGLVGFYLASSGQGGNLQRASWHRLVFYARDSFSLGRRIHLYAGLKFERIQAGLSAVYKGLSGSDLSFYAGEANLRPIYGVNPFGVVNYPSWDNMIVWYNLSPRLGLILDPLGRGRSLLKFSWGRYFDNLSLNSLMSFSPAWPTGYHLFYWYDENNDGKADTDDTFLPLPEDYRIHQENYFRKRVAPKLKSPFTNELTVTFEQQLGEDFVLSFSYLSRIRKRIIEDVLYDPDNDREWFASTDVNWIPFNTQVPGASGYGQTTVTVYFPSASSPALFTRINNVDFLKQKYSGWQLVLRKRMSDNWQLLASATWSKSQGNSGLSLGSSSALTQLANSPNSLVNISDRSYLDLDRPWIVKVMATYELPRGFYLSALFRYLSGTPWARTVTVVPPQSWLESHQALNLPATVYLEEPGSRRWPAFHTLDLRLEKSLKVGSETTLNVALDVLNTLGKKYALEDLNDGGYWYPNSEGSSSGTRIFNPNYQKILAIYGTRAAQLSFSLKF